MMDCCCLCDGLEEPGRFLISLTSKGKRTLVLASEERRDGISEKIESSVNLKVHADCRKAYTHPSNIQKQKRMSENSSGPEEIDAKKPKLRAKDDLFNFKKHCLFCGENILYNSKTSAERHKIVREVETLGFLDIIKNRIRDRGDSWGDEVLTRIEHSYDLVAAEARYHECCRTKFFLTQDSFSSRGRPKDDDTSLAFEGLCEYMEDNDECQYSLDELLARMQESMDGQSTWSAKYMKKKLESHFGNRVIITCLKGRSNIVTFKDSSMRILQDTWYTNRDSDPEAERMRIVQKAAAIIREDIRAKVYNCDEYPLSSSVLDCSELIPATLDSFLLTIIDSGRKKDKQQDVVKRRCSAIAQSIIGSCRPRSFISPVLLSIAVYIHRKYASKELIDILHSLMFCSSYREVQQYMNSIMQLEDCAYQLDRFVQFVFDNADSNIRTLDGHNTFHSMGGIASVAPKGSVPENIISRVKETAQKTENGSFGFIPIAQYQPSSSKHGLGSVQIRDFSVLCSSLTKVSPSALESLYIFGSIMEIPMPSWAGFMQIAHQNKVCVQSRIEILPFINLNPSDMSTIYTALKFVQSECDKHDLNMSPVTFDQPLYVKAVEIVESSDDLSKLFVRLGGFHLLMSFMGSIGTLMAGSGIEELWESVYAPGTVVHMLTGHAYARALRAHLLTQTALAKLIFDEKNLDESIASEIRCLIASLLDGTDLATDTANPSVEKAEQVFKRLSDQAKDGSRTGKLWMQYFQQVELIKDFVKAERTGNWDLHLTSVKSMIPHFHAAAHLAYAKCAHLYVQQMEDLATNMPEDDYISFSKLGYFTIRHSEMYWGGNFSDQTIEQCLMRVFKVSGGMTRGRGITDTTLAKWVAALPRCAPLCNALEQLSNVHTGDSEQHKDIRPSSQKRDKVDITKFFVWLRAHHPFQNRQVEQLVSLSTGKIADSSVNCDNAISVGETLVKNVAGKTFPSVKLRRKDAAKSLASMSNTITVRDDEVVVNPSLLFNRITCILESQEEMKEYLTYELSPQPPSLFENGGMRKTQKSVLATILKENERERTTLPEKPTFVLDGGYLIRAVVWPKQSTYRDVCSNYQTYISQHFGNDVHIVFDGYSNQTSTKIHEQTRRTKGRCSADVEVQLDLPITTSQNDFLANVANKSRLIEILSTSLHDAGVVVKLAESDADTLIIKTALDLASESDSDIVVVGTDTDLLVMLLAHGCDRMKLHMLTSVNPIKVYNICEIQESLGPTKYNLPVIHAISGCDTTSSLFKIGKKTAFKILCDKYQELMSVFVRDYSTKDEVAKSGEQLILALYGGSTTDSLDNFRYTAYRRSVAKTSLRSSFQLQSLPPTSAAAHEHSFRVYLQVQTWHFNQLRPLEWGWEERYGCLRPITSCNQVAPKSLLNFISCGCKSGCAKSCGCRKAGLFCSNICKICMGIDCTNVDQPGINLDEDGEN